MVNTKLDWNPTKSSNSTNITTCVDLFQNWFQNFNKKMSSKFTFLLSTKKCSRMSTGRPISQPGSKVMVDAKLSLGNLHLGYQNKTTATITEDLKLDSWKDVFFTKKNTTSDFRESIKKRIQCTVDGWNPAPVEVGISVYPSIHRVSYIPGGARRDGFQELRHSNDPMNGKWSNAWHPGVQFMGQNNPKQRVLQKATIFTC